MHLSIAAEPARNYPEPVSFPCSARGPLQRAAVSRASGMPREFPARLPALSHGSGWEMRHDEKSHHRAGSTEQTDWSSKWQEW